ncbi:MAG: TauD/TfdA family dioxygenase [Pseudomonadota bacterium]|nr:TauD/TfdA family dioxygenase [Pseudomonadota bacterium]
MSLRRIDLGPTKVRPDMTLEILPLAASLGAEIRGVDLSAPISDETFETIKDAWSTYSVLLFREQTLDHASHVAFSRRFGALDDHASIPKFRDPDVPEILRVANDVVGGRKQTVGQQWHSDLSITQQPAKASLLRSETLPPKGGDTLFASSYQAYEDLSPTMRNFLEGLTAIHDIAQSKQNQGRTDLDEARKRTPPIVHPVVRTHSVTGKKAIYVNEMSTSRIVELAPDESEAVLQFLFAHTTQHKYTYRHRWQVGDLLMWDNESTQHLALADYDINVPRVLYRTTLLGVPSGRQATADELL